MTKYIDRFYLNWEMYAIKVPDPNWRDTDNWQWVDGTRWLTDRWDWLGPVTNQSDTSAYIMKPIWPITGKIIEVNTKRYCSDPTMWGSLQALLMPMASFDDSSSAFDNKDKMDLAAFPLYQENPYDGMWWDFWDNTNQQTLRWDTPPYLSDFVSWQITWIVSIKAKFDTTTYTWQLTLNNTYTRTSDFSQSDTTFIDNLMADQDLALILHCGRWYGDASMNNRLISASYTITSAS